MSLYEDRYDTDWSSLNRNEAMERAFALGVAAALGERHDDEFEQIKQSMGTNYDASIVELAFKEGKQKGIKRKRTVEGDTLPEDIWEAVLSDKLDDIVPDAAGEDTTRATDLPPAVTYSARATDRPDLDPEQTEFPEFLE